MGKKGGALVTILPTISATRSQAYLRHRGHSCGLRVALSRGPCPAASSAARVGDLHLSTDGAQPIAGAPWPLPDTERGTQPSVGADVPMSKKAEWGESLVASMRRHQCLQTSSSETCLPLLPFWKLPPTDTRLGPRGIT
eukprot:scaffold731_cov261-Pinguiococcus_pyrenoidosus.AAC.7